MSQQTPETTPADHLRRAQAELAAGDESAAKTHALMAIAAALVAQTADNPRPATPHVGEWNIYGRPE